MNFDRRLICILLFLALVSYFIPWYKDWAFTYTGLHFGSSSLFAMITNVCLFGVLLIDTDTKKEISIPRLLIILVSQTATLCLVYYNFEQFWTFNLKVIYINTQLGLYLYTCSSIAIIAFCISKFIFQYKQRYPDNNELLDN